MSKLKLLVPCEQDRAEPHHQGIFTKIKQISHFGSWLWDGQLSQIKTENQLLRGVGGTGCGFCLYSGIYHRFHWTMYYQIRIVLNHCIFILLLKIHSASLTCKSIFCVLIEENEDASFHSHKSDYVLHWFRIIFFSFRSLVVCKHISFQFLWKTQPRWVSWFIILSGRLQFSRYKTRLLAL